MVRSLSIVAVLALLISFVGCAPFLDPTDGGHNGLVGTTIVGRVIDESGKSVQGALVRGHGKTTTTNANGVFVLKNVAVPETRAVIVVTKGGYFTGARAAFPSVNKITTVMLTLQEAKQTKSINAQSGGTVNIGGASVMLPANGYVDSQGGSYSGVISVAARYLDPASDTYYDSFSGDMAALRSDGSSVELTSYGVIRVLLTGSQGQTLNLAKGATATISYPSAGAIEPEIPLWHFDEKQGIWVEDGKATLEGNKYVGTVTHFTDWNLDKPNARRAYIEGRVTCGENLPLAGIVVDIGQVSVVTDQDGVYRRRVPADVTFDLQVKAVRNDGISSTSITVGPLSENQTLKQDIVVSPCPTMLEAQIVDCNDAPVGGFLQVITPTGVKVASSTTGKIRVTVPAAAALTLEGFSTDGRTIASTPVAPITAGALFDAGNLKACSGVETTYLDIAMPDNESPRLAALNSDGSRVVVVTQTSLFMYDATTGDKLWNTALQGAQQYPTCLRFVASSQRISICTYQGTTIYDAATGQATATINARGRQFAADNGQYVYVMPDSATDARIEEYDAQSGAKRRAVTISAQPLPGAYFMGLQGNGFAVVRRMSPSSLLTVDLTSGTIVRTYTNPADSTGVNEVTTLSPSGKIAVVSAARSGSNAGQMLVVDLISGTQISQIASGLSIYALSADDQQYVSKSYTQGAPITLSALRTQQLLRVLPWPSSTTTDYPAGFGFSDDAAKLVGITSGKSNNQGGTGSNARIRVYSIK